MYTSHFVQHVYDPAPAAARSAPLLSLVAEKGGKLLTGNALKEQGVACNPLIFGGIALVKFVVGRTAHRRHFQDCAIKIHAFPCQITVTCLAILRWEKAGRRFVL